MKKIFIFIVLHFLFTQSFAYDLSEKELTLSKYELKQEKNGYSYIKTIDNLLEKVKNLNYSSSLKLKNKIDTLELKYENNNSSNAVKIKKILKYLNLKLYFIISDIELTSKNNNKTVIINDPKIDLQISNETGKIITKAKINLYLYNGSEKILLSDNYELNFYPGFLPGNETKKDITLGYKRTKEALKATIGTDTINPKNIIISVNEVSDINGANYMDYGIKVEKKKEIKDKQTKLDQINIDIKGLQEKLNILQEKTEKTSDDYVSIENLKNQINQLNEEYNNLDPHWEVSMYYYELQIQEVVESFKINNFSVTQETK